MDALPDELVDMVLRRVPWRDRLQCAAICRRWHGVLSEPRAWIDVPREYFLEAALHAACSNGDFATAQRIVVQFGLAATASSEQKNCTMLWARNRGGIRTATWFAAALGVTNDDLPQWYPGEALGAACLDGDLTTAQWVMGKFDPAALDRAGTMFALRGACGEGHTHVAAWLVATLGIRGADGRGADGLGADGLGADGRGADGRGADGRGTDGLGADGLGADGLGADGLGADGLGTDGRGTDGLGAAGLGAAGLGAVLTSACNGGHAQVALWLVATFGVTAFNIRSDGNCALRFVCHNGHLELAMWLTSTFDISAEEIRADGVLRAAYTGGHLDVVRWLITTFSLGVDDTRAQATLSDICAEGHLGMVRWFIETFDLTADDIRAGHNAALRIACASAHYAVAEWLIESFKLTAFDGHAAITMTDSSTRIKIEPWLAARFGLDFFN